MGEPDTAVYFQPQEMVKYTHIRGGKTRILDAVVVKHKPRYVRIKTKIDGQVWHFLDVEPFLLERPKTE